MTSSDDALPGAFRSRGAGPPGLRCFQAPLKCLSHSPIDGPSRLNSSRYGPEVSPTTARRTPVGAPPLVPSSGRARTRSRAAFFCFSQRWNRS
jgi:hypothetical protein